MTFYCSVGCAGRPLARGVVAVIAHPIRGNYYPSEEPDAREVVDLIRQAGRHAVALPADIRTQAACEKLVTDAVQGLGGLDILVNNAAYQQSKADIAEISDEIERPGFQPAVPRNGGMLRSVR